MFFYSNLSGGVGTFNRPRRMMTAEHLGAAHSRERESVKNVAVFLRQKLRENIALIVDN